jgi:LPXTG-motif cell wall-anchored protein
MTVAVCVLVGAALLGGGTARADVPTLRFVGADTYYVSTTHQPPKLHNPQLVLRLAGSKGIYGNGRIVVDASALAGRATADLVPRNCTQAAMVFTCTEWMDDDTRDYPFALTAVTGTPLGFAADLVVTAETTGGPHATASTRVHTVVGTPDLRIPDVPTVSGVRPGSVVSDPVVVVNRGEVPPGNGFVLMGRSELGFDPAGEMPANCVYTPGKAMGPIGDTAFAFWCTFTQEIAPGTAYALDDPIALRTRPELVDGDVRYEIAPVGTDGALTLGALDYMSDTNIRGTGPALGLHPVPASGHTPTGFFAGDFHVLADQTADYRAVAATVRGSVGQTVQVSLQVRNAGPGSMAEKPIGDTGMDVTPPPGVTILSMHQGDPEEVPHPWWCTPKRSGATVYHCGMGPLVDHQLAPGDGYQVDVTLLIDRAVPGARGSVRVRRTAGETTYDADAADDVAPIVMDVSGATGPSGGTPAATSTGTELPATGANSGALAAAAALALAAGGAATVLTRRRRRG